MAESREIEEEVKSIERPSNDEAVLDKLVQFLRDVASAWKEADQEQRNKLARGLFDKVWIKGQSVIQW